MSPPRCPLFLLVLALSGCANLLHSSAPALQLYVLQPPQTERGASQPAAPSLRIARPLPGPGLNTDRIALLRSGNRLDYYAGSRWSAPLTEVVSDLELAVFRLDGTWSAVADDRSSFNADYLLQTSIDQFAADYPQEARPPRVRVELHGLLIRRSDGALLGSFAITQAQEAQENRMGSVVQAFAQAAGQAVLAVEAQADQLLRSAKLPAAP